MTVANPPSLLLRRSSAGLRKGLAPLRLFGIQYLLLISAMTCVRGFFLWRNWGPSAALVPASVYLRSFAVGWRFDTVVACYLLLAAVPFYAGSRALRGRRGGRLSSALLSGVFGVLAAAVLAVLLVDVEYYRTFGIHLNASVGEYAVGAREIAGTIWAQYPVVRYGLLFVGLTAALLLACRRALRAWEASAPARVLPEVAALPVVVALCVVGARGGLGTATLNWGAAYFSAHPFANQLALNGAFTLGRSLDVAFADRAAEAPAFFPPGEAEREVREALAEDGDAFLPGPSPLLRAVRGRAPRRPLNVVVVLLESWMAEHVGALGSRDGVTPEFDRLSGRGLLFRRFFATGTRTNRGIASTLFGFPGHQGASLLKRVAGASPPVGLPSLLRGRGYRTGFFYGGDLDFDNMRGFLAAAGVEKFVGEEDFGAHARETRWGAYDERLFAKALDFMGKAAGPYFLALLTLTNHEPYEVPEAFRLLTPAQSPRWDHLNALRYSDAALGGFLREAERRGLDRDTVFLLVADHGENRGAPVDLDWRRFHVPCLLLGPPGVVAPGVEDKVGSQPDLLPTLMHLLGGDYEHGAWGRDLFLDNRRNFAFVVHGDFWGILEGDRYVVDSVRVPARLYDLADASLERDLSLREPGRARAMTRTGRAILQAGGELLRLSPARR